VHFINGRRKRACAHAVEAWDDYTRKRVELYQAYEAQCQREGVVDFAELLLRSYELLSATSRCAEHYQRALPPHPGR
jgi:DNA helicase-2/ATP-dependent DNA helicase PcrA